ncbi:hypothetical protein WG70_11370 [Burkholderia oklahomensis EO147]|nr:hypothetical protein WG70_11370 [Burkholderia oklahomensis EO147]KUY58704.1 hypothetical protein WG70_00115 [Burkholderia oklahomensis EO147]
MSCEAAAVRAHARTACCAHRTAEHHARQYFPASGRRLAPTVEPPAAFAVPIPFGAPASAGAHDNHQTRDTCAAVSASSGATPDTRLASVVATVLA